MANIKDFVVWPKEPSMLDYPMLEPHMRFESSDQAIQYAKKLNSKTAIVEENVYWTEEDKKINNPIHFRKIWPKKAII